MTTPTKREDEDANRYIRPDTKTHIDHEKVRLKRKIWGKGLELIERHDLDGLVRLLTEAGFTSEQLAQAKRQYFEYEKTFP